MKIARLLILSLLIPVLAAATTSAPVTNTATETYFHYTWTYYSEAAKTNMVGERYRQDCNGYQSSWGSATAYFDYTRVPCDHESLHASTEQ